MEKANFHGAWMTENETMIYRVLPKCACSTIGQIMYFSDHGKFYDGDIHTNTEGVYKWELPGHTELIEDKILSGEVYTFTCARNPYARILSTFFDKICSIQANGRRYRDGDLTDQLSKSYGSDIFSDENKDDFDQIKNFRRFLLFARDTNKFRHPMRFDIHWASLSKHASRLISGGGKFNYIFHTENFKEGMKHVLDATDPPHHVDLDNMPRFNESGVNGPKPSHRVEEYFDDLSMHLMHEMYGRDFRLFGYDRNDPSNPKPVADIDYDRVHRALSKQR